MEPLQVGDQHPLVAEACLKLGVFPVSEEFTEVLAQRIRGFQLIHNIWQDGHLDDEVCRLLGIGD